MTLVQIWGLLIALTVGWWMTHIFLFLIVGCLTGGAWISYYPNLVGGTGLPWRVAGVVFCTQGHWM